MMPNVIGSFNDQGKKESQIETVLELKPERPDYLST